MRITNRIQQIRDCQHLQHTGIRLSARHQPAPEFIDISKTSALQRKLFCDVLRIEDRVQVHPQHLHFNPFFQDITHQLQLVAPLDDLCFEGFLEWTELHPLGLQ